MKLHHVIRLLVGSTAIYLALAMSHGCGGSDPGLYPSGGSGGAGGNHGATASAGKGGASSTGSVMNPVPDANANESGSRIKAKYYVGSDGSRQWAGWYDSQRKEDCYYQYASDEAFRCMPSVGYASTGYFSDAACTKEFAVRANTCALAEAKYVVRVTTAASQCVPGKVQWFQTAGKLTGVTSFYYKNGTTCSASPIITSYEFYAIGPEIPPTEFVAATTTIE